MISDADRAEIARVFGPEVAASNELPTKEQIADSMLLMMNDLTDAERTEMREEFIRDFSLGGLMTLMVSMQEMASR